MLRYVKGTVGEGLLYKRGAQVGVWGYSDAGHAGDRETSRGRSGYVFLSAGAAVSWRSSMMLLHTTIVSHGMWALVKREMRQSICSNFRER